MNDDGGGSRPIKSLRHRHKEVSIEAWASYKLYASLNTDIVNGRPLEWHTFSVNPHASVRPFYLCEPSSKATFPQWGLWWFNPFGLCLRHEPGKMVTIFIPWISSRMNTSHRACGYWKTLENTCWCFENRRKSQYSFIANLSPYLLKHFSFLCLHKNA